jgi:hypothetical protein
VRILLLAVFLAFWFWMALETRHKQRVASGELCRAWNRASCEARKLRLRE